MNILTTYATRANVALARDAAMISFQSPCGPLLDGVVTTEESARLVVSFITLREMAELLSRKVAELDAAEVTRAADHQASQVKRVVEQCSIRDEEELEDRAPTLLQ